MDFSASFEAKRSRIVEDSYVQPLNAGTNQPVTQTPEAYLSCANLEKNSPLESCEQAALLAPGSSVTSSADDTFSFAASPTSIAMEGDRSNQRQVSSCLRSDVRSPARPPRHVMFSDGPNLEVYEDGHRPENIPRLRPSVLPRTIPAPREGLSRMNLLALVDELGSDFREQNALSIIRLKRRVRSCFASVQSM